MGICPPLTMHRPYPGGAAAVTCIAWRFNAWTSLRHLTFAVTDIDGTIAALETEGGELVAQVVRYESIYRLCYLRGPAGVIIELAERID